MKSTRAFTFVAYTALIVATFIGRAGAAPTGLENLLGPNIDVAVCKAYMAGAVLTPGNEQVMGIIKPRNHNDGWQVTMPGQDRLPISFLIGLKDEVEIGSIEFGGNVTQLSILKPGGAYPPDPAKTEQWQEITIPPSQSGGGLIALPAGTKTHALLLSAPHNWRHARLDFVRLMSARLNNVVPLAMAYAESEYWEYSMFAPPRVYAASLVTAGTGVWQNTGKDEMAKIHRAPVTDLDPSWFVLSWDEPQTIRGLWLDDNFDQVRIESYNGPKDLNPRAGRDAEWDVIPNQAPVAGTYRFVTFPPITTRGLRLTILATHDKEYPACPIARILGYHVFSDAQGDKPLARPAASQDDAPPVVISYKMDFDGEATMVINGPDGRRVKNLFARRPKQKGDNQVGWDLKDEQGRIVPAGVYEWKSIAHPPLHLKYEFTVYPNVGENSPVNPSWHTSMSGPGGWLADHTSNLSGTAGGDFVFFGAPVAESGVSMICCDLTGRKLWAIPSFAGFTGAYHAAATADGKTVYVSAPGANMQLDPRAEVVWAVDVESHKFKEVARLFPTSSRQRGIKSMAAHDGKLFIAVGAEEDWFAAAAGPDDVDIERCVPVYAATRLPRYPHEAPPDPRGDFERLFRLTGQPAGGHALTYIESLPGKTPRRYVALLFNRPIPIGSAILPVPTDPSLKIKLFVLKPDAPYPPNPGDPTQWIAFSTQAKLPWDVATAPPNTRTRALRIVFSRGDANTDDDLLGADDSAEFKTGQQESGALKLKEKDKDDSTAGLGSGPAGSWIGKMEGLKIISRRFENVAGLASVKVNSGTVGADGVWDAKRTQAISDSDPGIYMMSWKQPQSLRGLGFKEVDGKRTEIDVFTGPEDKPIDMNAAAGWRHVGTYIQPRREYYWPDPRNNVDARYLDGYVDFGEEFQTRAIRLRVCEQWQSVMGSPGTHVAGPRFDVKGTDSTRCRIFGVAAMKYIGGEGEAVDPRAFQRIETLDPQTGQITAEVPLAKPVAMAFNQQGALLGICGKSVVAIDVASGKSTPLVSGDLEEPQAFAIDKTGNLYVYDNAADRKNIRVYTPAGKFLHAIGTPGGYRMGPWDPTRFQNITTLVIDSKQQLWAVDNTYFPKRISLWTLDGTWQKDFLGNTAYGGGGVLDPQDKTRLFYGPLEFAIDWKTGHSHLKNLTWLGEGRAGEEPVYVNGRNYMVTRYDPPGPMQECGIVYLYEKDHLRRVAAMGHASEFPPLTKPELQAQLGNPSLLDSNFVWSDLNGDGEVQANEVTIRPKTATEISLTRFDKDLGIQSQAIRFQVNHFLPNGVPVYEIKEMRGLAGLRNLLRMDDGNYMGENALINGLYTPDGKSIWTYPNEGMSTQGLTSAGPYTPEQVVAEFSWVSHTVANAGDLGEFTFIHTNTGIWNLWTADGLLAGSIFSDLRLPGVRAWNMPEHERGMSLDNLTPGQEHFSGYFCKTSDNHYYAIAGHNHISLVEVLGMDNFKRYSGKIDVTSAEIARTDAWAQTRQRHKVYQRTPVLDCYHIETPMPTNGDLRKWDTVAAELGKKDRARIEHGAVLRMAYDAQYLYLCYEVDGLGPMKNTGEQWDRLFKTGAAVDLQIGTDPAAPRDRKAPVAGDKRLLLTFVNNKPMAILYDAVVPGTPSAAAWKAVSPVGQVSFDRVVQLSTVRMVYSGSDDRYVLEAAVPLDVLGLKPVDDMRLKLDWGLLSADPNGNSVMQRIYWSNGATGIIADVPSEAQLHPDLWGYVLFHDRSRHPAVPTHLLGSKEGDNPSSKKPNVKDIERELNGDK